MSFSISVAAETPTWPRWLPSASLQDNNVVFRSDVSLVRVDVRVVGGNKFAITGLNTGDFVLSEAISC